MNARPRIFRAARTVTLDDTDPAAFAVVGEHVAGTGDTGELRARFPSAEVVDLDGALVVPGFNDAHCHPSWSAAMRRYVDVSAATNAAEVFLLLSEHARARSAGGWIRARGYVAAGDRIDRALLDRVTGDDPVVVVLSWLHAAVVNTRALELAGYTDDSADPVGGRLGRDGAGRLDGWLYEQAWFEPYWGRPGFGDVDVGVDALVAENTYLNSFGVTSFCDAIVTPESWRLYQRTRAQGELTARVGVLLWHTFLDGVGELGIGDEWLRYVGVKTMYDGAISGGTCLSSEPYPSATGTDNGERLVDAAEFPTLIQAIHSAGHRACVHANGDEAIAAVLDAIEAAQRRDPRAGVAHRVEHCSMTDGDTIARLAAAGVVAVPFGQFIQCHGDRFVEFYGRDRAARLLAHRSMLDAGVVVAGSSDYPAGPPSPLLAIQSMVTRTTAGGHTLGAHERVSPRQALEVYAVGSARATGEERTKGRLVPGQLADFAVLDRDIFAVDPATIGDTRVLSTWVGGEQVWPKPARDRRQGVSR